MELFDSLDSPGQLIVASSLALIVSILPRFVEDVGANIGWWIRGSPSRHVFDLGKTDLGRMAEVLSLYFVNEVKILIDSINKLNISFTIFFVLIQLSNRNMLKFLFQKNNVVFFCCCFFSFWHFSYPKILT